MALHEDDVDAVFIHQGLASYRSVLNMPHVYIPHDAVVPQALDAGDFSEIASALVPTRLRLTAMVDALNRRLTDVQVRKAYSGLPPSQLEVTQIGGESDAAAWLIESLE
ncbi:MAG: hypothetical protein CMJ64_14100 [Planctomycetaceae bacterium]|nr:hypothetical protein [Planctomycetaceae bacterium]